MNGYGCLEKDLYQSTWSARLIFCWLENAASFAWIIVSCRCRLTEDQMHSIQCSIYTKTGMCKSTFASHDAMWRLWSAICYLAMKYLTHYMTSMHITLQPKSVFGNLQWCRWSAQAWPGACTQCTLHIAQPSADICQPNFNRVSMHKHHMWDSSEQLWHDDEYSPKGYSDCNNGISDTSPFTWS